MHYTIKTMLIVTIFLILCGIQNTNASSPPQIVVSAPRAIYNGEICDVTISLTTSMHACMLQLAVTYDEEYFEVVKTEAGGVFDGCVAPPINASQPGEIIICWDGITHLAQKGYCLQLRLKQRRSQKTYSYAFQTNTNSFVVMQIILIFIS